MAEVARDRGRVRIGDFEFDQRTGELWKDGIRTVLPEQIYRLLSLLVQARGDLVGRDELRHALWPDDTFVDFEHGLNAAVKRLREALGDSAAAPRFIETLPRRGYRLVAPVSSLIPRSALVSSKLPLSLGLSNWRWLWAASAVLLALAVVGGRRLGSSTVSGTDGSSPTLTRLTSTDGVNIDPALTSDGSLLAYASDREGGSGLDIWVQPIAGGQARRITVGPGDEVEPSFSPDGVWIAYATRETGGIFVVRVTGGESREIAVASRAHAPRFSPDGRQVLYWTGMPIWSVAEDTPFAGGALYTVPFEGGRSREIAPDFASARFGLWSPDGRAVLFLGRRDADIGSFDWYVIGANGTAVRSGAFAVLHRGGFNGLPVPTGWDREGSVVLAGGSQDRSNVWRLMVDPETGIAQGEPKRLTFGTAVELSPTISASRSLAFASLVQNVDVWRVALDPLTGTASGPLERLTHAPSRDRLMNVSSDGLAVAYVSSRHEGEVGVVRDLATGAEREIAMTGQFRIDPTASVAAVTRPGASGIDLIRIRDGVTTPLCDACEDVGWSDDGRRLVVGEGEQSRLVVYDTTTGRGLLLTSHPTWRLTQPRFSPDGHWVAFHTTNSPSLRQVYVVSATAPTPVPVEQWVPVITDFGVQPRWSRDGRSIYYFSIRDGSMCAWLQPLSPTMHPSGPSRPVQHFHDPRLAGVVRAFVTHDEQAGYLFATLTETTGNIWMIDGRAGAIR
ncbi:MAG TPA: winged helix-turn-helix domain-containing protein [Vicinamibacterales bacterium]|nr:winged helix-turn-helix domain-containing protein [Vicinamibacterales bacterium]